MPQEIQTVYAFLAVDNDVEGILAYEVPGGEPVPMITCSTKLMELYRDHLIPQMIETGQLDNCRLVEFSCRRVARVFRSPSAALRKEPA